CRAARGSAEDHGPAGVGFGEANIDARFAASRPPEAIEPLTNGGDARLHLGIRFGPAYQNSNPSDEIGLLRARRKRPRRRHATEKRDEGAALHSITSSARASSVGGTSMPSALAVLRLMTSSSLVGNSMGKSATGGPFSILYT